MFTPLEKAWLTQSLTTQRQALTRSRAKEMTGGEIYTLRTKEIHQLEQLQTKIESLQNAPTPPEPGQQTKK